MQLQYITTRLLKYDQKQMLVNELNGKTKIYPQQLLTGPNTQRLLYLGTDSGMTRLCCRVLLYLRVVVLCEDPDILVRHLKESMIVGYH